MELLLAATQQAATAFLCRPQGSRPAAAAAPAVPWRLAPERGACQQPAKGAAGRATEAAGVLTGPPGCAWRFPGSQRDGGVLVNAADASGRSSRAACRAAEAAACQPARCGQVQSARFSDYGKCHQGFSPTGTAVRLRTLYVCSGFGPVKRQGRAVPCPSSCCAVLGERGSCLTGKSQWERSMVLLSAGGPIKGWG